MVIKGEGPGSPSSMNRPDHDFGKVKFAISSNALLRKIILIIELPMLFL